jgi:hypothetical protein
VALVAHSRQANNFIFFMLLIMRMLHYFLPRSFGEQVLLL